MRSERNRQNGNEKGQALIWALLLTLVMIVVAAALVDIFRLIEVRNWAYAVAQEAALRGVSLGRDWSSVTATGEMSLDGSVAVASAETVVSSEMAFRGITNYSMDVRVLPNPTGGAEAGYPPQNVRLGAVGDWSSTKPAVGVYLAVKVENLTLLRFVGISDGWVYAFVAGTVSPSVP